MKKISVIVPCYNVEREIDRCVQSLVAQSLSISNMELIFVDDASEDSTAQKLSVWEARYPDSIIVIRCTENGKQGTARNIGMQYATGEYIGFVDSDDYVEPAMYREMCRIADDERVDMVTCLFVREEEDGTIAIDAEKRADAGKSIWIRTEEERKKYMKNGSGGGVWSSIYRREFIIENQLWFPEGVRYEDNYWGAFLAQALSGYYIINKPFYHYVIHNGSTIMQTNAVHHLDRLVVELMKVEEYERRGLLEKYHDEIEFNFLKMYFINTIRILFVRFREIPYDIIYIMQQNVKELFPDYRQNPYLKELPQLQWELLKMVEIPLNKEKIDILADGYRKVLREWQNQQKGWNS